MQAATHHSKQNSAASYSARPRETPFLINTLRNYSVIILFINMYRGNEDRDDDRYGIRGDYFGKSSCNDRGLNYRGDYPRSGAQYGQGRHGFSGDRDRDYSFGQDQRPWSCTPCHQQNGYGAGGANEFISDRYGIDRYGVPGQGAYSERYGLSGQFQQGEHGGGHCGDRCGYNGQPRWGDRCGNRYVGDRSCDYRDCGFYGQQQQPSSRGGQVSAFYGGVGVGGQDGGGHSDNYNRFRGGNFPSGR
ncbi:hypothetical protein BV898_01774 [Hypsibius exemplaris]|uniref:Uncharacterized protein n=1 Tax=Hypsibius exemplaris TaxID=2072580 RepID=A0A1W0XAD3_HYPEX|nr:hypothetical protein BV898_01774 [Hypsibius exemplaris]